MADFYENDIERWARLEFFYIKLSFMIIFIFYLSSTTLLLYVASFFFQWRLECAKYVLLLAIWCNIKKKYVSLILTIFHLYHDEAFFNILKMIIFIGGNFLKELFYKKNQFSTFCFFNLNNFLSSSRFPIDDFLRDWLLTEIWLLVFWVRESMSWIMKELLWNI